MRSTLCRVCGLPPFLVGVGHMQGPTVDLVRSPYGGRSAETLAGEEPFLGAPLTAAYVRGLKAARVASVVKHFALNNQETGRMGGMSSDAGQRTLDEAHYVPVKAAIEAGVSAVMCSYNLVNGTQACGADWLLRDDLIGRLGFDGYVVSDWTAIYDVRVAAAGAVHIDMPGVAGVFRCPGMLTEAQLDEKASAILRGMILDLPAMRAPPCIVGCDCDVLMREANASTPAHIELARTVAAESAVLLKNEAETLPIRTGSVIALVGSACDHQSNWETLSGWWNRGDYNVVGGSGRVISDRAVSVAAGLAARSAGHGFTLRTSLTDDVSAALEVMKGATLTVACAGAIGQEGDDRTSLLLDQDAFLARLTTDRTGPLAVVAFAPGPLAVGSWSTQADAALAVFLSGQETGAAVASLLLGDSSPSGKLPVTFYADESQVVVPICTTVRCEYTERLHVGWRALEDTPVAFPFGHGLSYAAFNFSLVGRDARWATVTVLNVGSAAAREVVQLYVRTAEPLTTLRAFAKTSVLLPGQSQTVRLDMGTVDSASEQVMVGASSRDVRLRW